MAAISLCDSSIADLKKALRNDLLDVKSSHICEALAASMGFRTYASLRASMVGSDEDRPFMLLDSKRFTERLVEFGYPEDPEFDFEFLAGVVSTTPSSAYEIDYKSDRSKAWRNLMVCAVNAALDQKLFTLRPGDNRFSKNSPYERLFEFTLPNGLRAKGAVSDAGFDEVAVHAAVNPKGQYVSAQAGFDCGDAVGMTWVERERGAWMQTSQTMFSCRRALVHQLASLSVSPQGYGDRGHVIM